jgi:hypothetical protein
MWPSELIPGIGVSQVPIILAWALTIHKAQGSTLDIAEVDAGSGIFECGQTYVALSRVKSLEGLYLSSFDAKRVKINKKVQEFYEILEKNQKKEDAKNINIEETNKREIEKLPEAYVEAVIIPFVEVTIVEATLIIESIPIIEAISENENTDFSQFEY